MQEQFNRCKTAFDSCDTDDIHSSMTISKVQLNNKTQPKPTCKLGYSTINVML